MFHFRQLLCAGPTPKPAPLLPCIRDQVDSSGFGFNYSSVLRPNDVGMLVLGRCAGGRGQAGAGGRWGWGRGAGGGGEGAGGGRRGGR